MKRAACNYNVPLQPVEGKVQISKENATSPMSTHKPRQKHKPTSLRVKRRLSDLPIMYLCLSLVCLVNEKSHYLAFHFEHPPQCPLGNIDQVNSMWREEACDCYECTVLWATWKTQRSRGSRETSSWRMWHPVVSVSRDPPTSLFTSPQKCVANKVAPIAAVTRTVQHVSVTVYTVCCHLPFTQQFY